MPRPGVGNPGNKGGGRLGYVYEKDQLQRLRKIADRGIAMIEAIQRGKVTEKEIEKYKVIEKSLLKVLDKLQPNKMQTEHSGEIRIPQPLLSNLNVPNSNSEQENTESEETD